MFSGQHLIQRLPQILQQVKPIRYLDRLRRPLTCALSRSTASVPTHDLHLLAVVLLQPGGHSRAFPVGQHVNDAVLVEIYQDRPIVPTAPEGEIVHPEDTEIGRDCVSSGDVSAVDEAQQGIPARPSGCQMQVSDQTLSCLATQSEAHGL